jgi:hypothetical protein
MRSFPPGQSVVMILLSPRPARKASRGDAEIARINTKRRERAARAEHTQRCFEGLLGPQRLDCDVHAATASDLHDLINRVCAPEIDDVIGSHSPRHLGSLGNSFDTDNRRCPHQLGAGRRA